MSLPSVPKHFVADRNPSASVEEQHTQDPLEKIRQGDAMGDVHAAARSPEPATPRDWGTPDRNMQPNTMSGYFAPGMYETRAEEKNERHAYLRMMPIAFAVALLDRSNLSAAFVIGLADDLELSRDSRYNIISCSLYISHMCFLPAIVVFCQRYSARWWLSTCVLVWGGVCIAAGFVNHWSQLLACRIVLGALEACFLQRSHCLLFMTYANRELGKRFAVFSLSGVSMAAVVDISSRKFASDLQNRAHGLSSVQHVMSAFSPLLNEAFSRTPTWGPTHRWSWIFIWAGVLTVIVAVPVLLFVGDVETAPWLTERERDMLAGKTHSLTQVPCAEAKSKDVEVATRHQRGVHLGAGEVLTIMREQRLLFASTALFCTALFPAILLAYFLPIILVDVGFSGDAALIMSAPVKLSGLAVGLASAVIADRYRARLAAVMTGNVITSIGLGLLLFEVSKVRFGGAFLVDIGAAISVANVPPLQAANFADIKVKSVSAGCLTLGSALAGIVATLVFRTQDRPKFLLGLSWGFATQALSLLLCIAMILYLSHMNRLARQGLVIIQSKREFRYSF
ncbi:MFS general substrate transporter [Ceraceosorus guamensis]|uniref:MFS general substrate transporter n=1 Tax=Ceraceosorus guamensis TaxID=1522189 RepID=A0A316W8P0_9BASI|nr:MFS general substrate transporter [Ceraceosorus guamensis]PWN45131.1 MFS general substrate transporter [Ceraceosorus guamensis]